MDTVLQGIPGVICYIDDIFVSGKDHLQSMGEVFRRLQAHHFQLKQEKCQFLLLSVEYLGHQINRNGIQPLQSKVEAIVVNAPVPKNVQELRSFLGLLNYYGKFIPNLATILPPPPHPSTPSYELMPSGFGLRNVMKHSLQPNHNSHPARYLPTMIQLCHSL